MQAIVRNIVPTSTNSPSFKSVPFSGRSASEKTVVDFLMEAGNECKGISEYWRKNRSNVESSELANILSALRKVCGHLGNNIGRIEWSGMSLNGQSSIVLDPSIVMGKYPIPFHTFDYLVGLVTHEGCHQVEWSDLVWRKLEKACTKMKVIEKIMFHKLIYYGEDIYVDLISEKSMILGEYCEKYRDIALKRAKREVGTDQTSFDELVLQWRYRVFKKNSSSSSIKPYEEPLAILDSLTEELRLTRLSKKGASYRCDYRSNVYLDYWNKLKDLVSGWTIIDKTLLWHPKNTSHPLPNKRGGKTQVQDKGLPKTVSLEVETKLAADSADLTPIIRSLINDETQEIAPISRWDFNIQAHPVIDQRMSKRLKMIFQNYSERKTVLNRGLTSGRLDRRKLYRAPINGKCFQEKQKIPMLNWNICLLVDGSGSMKGQKQQMVENTIGTVHQSFQGFNNQLHAYAYFEIDGVCMISKLVEGKKLFSIPPSGQTASGQAIIAAAYLMPKDHGKRFIIHITDGKSNFGCDVQSGINYCETEGINLVTLGIGCKNRTEMTEQYGKSIQFLDCFDQVPAVLENLLKWALLTEGKRKLQILTGKNKPGKNFS